MTESGISTSFLNWVWLAYIAIMAMTSVFMAFWSEQSWGWSALVLLVGVTIVAGISLLAVLSARKNAATDLDDISLFRSDSANGLITALPIPSLLMVDGVPVAASQSYLNLTQGLGLDSTVDTPAPLDRVFNVNEKSSSSALFRLHHTRPGDGTCHELIQTVNADGELISYDVYVQAFDHYQLWQLKIRDENNKAPGLLEAAPVGLVSVTSNGHVLQINDVLRGWLGLSATSKPASLADIIENPEVVLGGDIEKGRTIRAESRLLTQKGFITPTILSARWHELDSGDAYASIALYGHAGLGLAVGDAKDTKSKKILHTEKSASDVFADTPFGVLWLDSPELETAKILEANSTIRTMLQDVNLEGAQFSALFKPGEHLDKLIAQGVHETPNMYDVSLSGENTPTVNVFFSDTQHFGLIAFVVDISQRKLLESQLGQSQKMQAIGQLAGGVAHDFNNLLTAIRLNTDELLGRHPIGDPSYPELQKINQTVSRAAGLVRKLLAFSRKQTMRTEALNVTETLSDIGVLLDQVLGERVKLDIQHGRGLPPILADRTQLETVLMNLSVNARDAMLETGGGTIVVRSSIPDEAILSAENIRATDDQSFVLVEVIDTGTGMDAATQQKIFEPFFTTKEQGKGTGLGLATVYGIVEQLGAQMRLHSQLGIGTTFKLFLPVATGDAVTIAPALVKPKPTVAPKPTDLAGTGNILFVEDEVAVRTIAAKTLRKRGYSVMEAGDGEEAYDILKQADGPFDLMISDVVMPGMDGPTLLKKGRDLLGDAQIVFISGYAEEEFSDLLAEEPDVTFLPKPFTLKELAEKVKTVLQDVA